MISSSSGGQTRERWICTIVSATFLTLSIHSARGFAPQRVSCQQRSVNFYRPIFASSLKTTSDSPYSTNHENNYNPTLEANKHLGQFISQASRLRSFIKKAQLGTQALKFFNNIDFEQRDTVTYNSLFQVLAKLSPVYVSGHPAAHIADSILQEMKKRHEDQIAANAAFYERLKTSEPDSSSVPPMIRVAPTVRSYSAVMDAFARIGTEGSAARVEELFEELESVAATNPAMEPNLIIHNIVLTAFAKAQNADACLEWLEHRMPIAPDRISYNTVLHALARSGQADAAEAFMRRMNVPPNTRTYAVVIDAWGRAGHADRAHELLRELIQLYQTTGDQYLAPNPVAYTSVIHAYALSKDPAKVEKGQQVLDTMIKARVQPNTFTYNSLLNCCATNGGVATDNMETVKEVYQTIMEKDIPDEATFGTVLKACANQFSWANDPDFCLQVFRDARDNGFLSSGVLRQFFLTVPVEVYREQVPDGTTEIAALPAEWSRNSAQKKRPTHKPR